MSALFAAVNTKMGKTENGAAAHTSTLNACLDLFSQAGASRGKDITSAFAKAKAEDLKLATQILFWLRDVRGGAGERQLFRDNVLSITTKENALQVVRKTVEVGRWDDLQVFLGTQYEDLVVSVTADALLTENALTAKWTPRSGAMFNLLRKKMELTPKELRKMLVRLSNTVEQLMSAGKWNEIDFSKLPSVASSRYMTAFHRNDSDRYEAYKNALVKGEAKINAGAVYPYDITKNIKRERFNSGSTTVQVAEQQWKALPDYMEGNTLKVLPVIDVSSSMDCPAGGSKSVTCMDVAVGLGMYIAERNGSFFKDQFITFHEKPEMYKMEGRLSDRMRAVYSAKWGGNTDLKATFDLILNAAVKHRLSADDMPTDIIILSDMQFDRADRKGNKTLFEVIRKQYEKAGYQMPRLVFWDLRAVGNYTVQQHETGTSLVSGFSPSLLKSILGGVNQTPYDTMLDTVNVERYTL
jgi:hypothetical protein